MEIQYMSNTDLTFITNEEQKNLKARFQALIKDTKLFDCLVGYFYTSGFHAIYKSLENTEKIRILIGISTGRQTYELLTEARNDQSRKHSGALQFSHAETKQVYEGLVEQEMENSEDKREVEEGVAKFIEWIKNNKLEIKAYPSKNIHAKLYIRTFTEGDRDVGRVITGSSNFTYSGLVENLEFNVELKNRADYEFAKQKFEELWRNAVDVSEKYIQTIQEKTWLNPEITPYQLYLKLLYEYFKDELSQTDEMFSKYFPQEFMKLKYQEEAVFDTKRKLEEYGGVFISDVVGLGKTYISAMLAGQIDGRTLVIAPPVLLDKTNPGSWPNVFSDFRVPADFESIGKLDLIIRRGTEKYKNIIIDEAHRFRTETNITYEKLAEICRGKRVILVTATPYNNSPKDILSQIKLFQKARRSTIPNLPDLEAFFKDLECDLEILTTIKSLWQKIKRDPKLLTFLDELSNGDNLQSKLIVFTESKETAEYLAKNINLKFADTALCFTGGSGEATRDKVIDNFDAKVRHPKNDYRILVSTEVLSEGVNLHRSNVVINYDIPWNPTRMMQRVGRINRVDTTFDKIYTFNFFPTEQSNDQIKLKEAAESKINAFLTLLGGDAALLTEGEPVGSHELFNRLISKKTLTGEEETEESELKYLHVIKDVRDKNPDLFEKIKRLPKKARTAKVTQAFNVSQASQPEVEPTHTSHRQDVCDTLVTYFRRGKLQKFFMADKSPAAQELDFMSAASTLESAIDDKKQKLPEEFYDLLDKNKQAFIFATTEEMAEPQRRSGRDSAAQMLKILKATVKNTQQFTDDQEHYLKQVIVQLEEGGLPKQTAKETLKALNALNQDILNPFKVLGTLQSHVPERFLQEHYAEQNPRSFGKREVILSMYLTGR